MRRVSVLYLYCGVLDAKLVVQLTANTTKETIFTRRIWHHKVCRQCGFGRTHPPNVEVVYIRHIWQGTQVRFNITYFNILRQRVVPPAN